MSMENDDGDLVLKELGRKERLKKIVYEAPLDYYLPNNVALKLLRVTAIICALVYAVSKGENFALFYFAGIVMFLEIGRQNKRFNALLELIDIDSVGCKKEEVDESSESN